MIFNIWMIGVVITFIFCISMQDDFLDYVYTELKEDITDIEVFSLFSICSLLWPLFICTVVYFYINDKNS